MKRQVGIIFLLFFCCSNNLAMNNNNEKKMKNKGIRSSNDCAIVFRTRCNPGPALELRILRWSRSLSARPIGQRCDIWVSSDVSRKLYTEKEILFASSGVLKTLHVNKNKNKNTVRNDAKSVWFEVFRRKKECSPLFRVRPVPMHPACGVGAEGAGGNRRFRRGSS